MAQLSVAKYQKLGPTAKNRLQIWNILEKLRVKVNKIIIFHIANKTK